MKKQTLHKLATVVGAIVTFAVCTGSFWWGNQPKVPANMLAKK